MLDSLLAKVFTGFAQFLVKIQPIWDKYKLLLMLVLGIFIGWFVLGWGLFPVSWVNATPGHLRADYKSAYLAYVAEELQRTNDPQLARARVGLDLPKSKSVPWLADADALEADITYAIDSASRFKIQDKVQTLGILKSRLPELSNIPSTEAQPPAGGGLARIIGIALLILLLALTAVALIYWVVVRNQRKAAASETAAMPEDTLTYGGVAGTETPLKSFTTPYVLGDDYFDPSFSIEVGSEFLGECGIGISETIGADDPKKVVAFEAWLFDKSDIRTVTTVLASEYAYHDPDLRAKLEPKGEIALMEPGTEIELETTSLRVTAKVKDVEYAQGNLPENSFVKKVDFELTAWVKHAGASAPIA